MRRLLVLMLYRLSFLFEDWAERLAFAPLRPILRDITEALDGFDISKVEEVSWEDLRIRVKEGRLPIHDVLRTTSTGR